MPRSSQFEIFGDGEYTYDDRYDASEFTTYGQSRGPTSTPFSNGVSHGGNTSPSSSRTSLQPPYDEYGYPIEGAYAGEEDLRRRVSRYQMGESSIHTGSRTSLGGDDQHAYEFGRHSRLSEQLYSSEREVRREARHREQAEPDSQMQREQERACRLAERDAFASRGSGRRDAVTTHNDKYLVFQQALREQRQHEYEETPEMCVGMGGDISLRTNSGRGRVSLGVEPMVSEP